MAAELYDLACIRLLFERNHDSNLVHVFTKFTQSFEPGLVLGTSVDTN